MRSDLAYAARSLLRQPAFALAAVATLALGIGATTAIFSTVNAALLRPLPYPRSQDLRVLGTAMTDGRVTTGRIAPIEVTRLNDPALSIVKVAATTSPIDATLIGNDGTPVLLTVCAVGDGFFDLIGLPMAAGRSFIHDEHVVTKGNGPPPVAIISHRLWRDLFGRDPAVVGKSIRVLEFGIPLSIVGVAAADLDVPHRTDLWFNLRVDPANQSHSFDGYLRVRPGTTPERLRMELAGIMGRLAQEFPSIDRMRVYTVRTLIEAIVGDLGPTLMLVLAASVLLLMLACVNVTNLLLTSSAVRAREMAIRVALGATRGRIIRQLLTESLVLVAAGTVLAMGLAYASVRLLLWYGASRLPRLASIPFDTNVLLFALVALVTISMLVGLTPALRLAATDITNVMNAGGRSATAGRAQHRTMMILVVAEIALAIVLVAGAGWLVRSFANLEASDPGFVADGRLAVDVLLPFVKYNSPDRVLAWSREVTERLRAISGVRTVGSAPVFPLHPGRNTMGVTYVALQGQPDDPDHPRPAHYFSVSPEFFDAMGIKLITGRGFTADDRPGTSPVAVVNRSFVRRYLPGHDPLATQFTFGYPTIDPKTMRPIVGVVDDVKYGSLADPPEPMLYLPQAQWPYWQQTLVVATTLRDPLTVVPAVRDAIGRVDPQLLIQVDSVPRIVASSLNLQRLGLTLMITFAVTALGLAAIGIYGVIAYASAQRVGEVAIRMALGAALTDVFWLIVRQGRTVAVAGVLLGLAAAFATGRVVTSALYEVRAFDPLILLSAGGTVVIITIVAVVLPARRVASVSPARVLRLD